MRAAEHKLLTNCALILLTMMTIETKPCHSKFMSPVLLNNDDTSVDSTRRLIDS